MLVTSPFLFLWLLNFLLYCDHAVFYLVFEIVWIQDIA